MDCAAAVFGGATLSPSLATNARLLHLSPRRQTSHLAAFRSASHLFTRSSSFKAPQNPRIFLPHLIASLEVEETYIDGVQRGLAWKGVGVVASARKLIGATNPLNAEPGTIRGDLAVQTGRNVVHGSDSPENGKREIDFAVPRRKALALFLSGFFIYSQAGTCDNALANPLVFREYVDQFDGYTLKYPSNWIQVRGAGADIFFRDPFVLDENISVNISSPSSSNYKSVEDLGSPEEAGKKVLRQYLTEFMSTRLGVRRESRILSTSSRVASDGKLYYEVQANIKSYANNNELAVMPEDRVARLEWDRRYLSVLGVENNRLYELRLQTPEKTFAEEEKELREIMDAFRVNTVAA